MNQSLSEFDTFTYQEFLALTTRYAELLETDPDVRKKYVKMCGSLARAQVFTRKGGVGIGKFAELVAAPVTTVRHYLRLSLIRPIAVNGNFRFEPGNLAEFEAVRQWQELGLSLKEILEMRQRNHMTLSLVRLEVEAEKVITSQRASDEDISKLEAMYGPDVTLMPLTPEQVRRAGVNLGEVPNEMILLEYKALREKLEARKAKIEQQLSRVAQLEAALSSS